MARTPGSKKQVQGTVKVSPGGGSDRSLVVELIDTGLDADAVKARLRKMALVVAGSVEVLSDGDSSQIALSHRWRDTTAAGTAIRNVLRPMRLAVAEQSSSLATKPTAKKTAESRDRVAAATGAAVVSRTVQVPGKKTAPAKDDSKAPAKKLTSARSTRRTATMDTKGGRTRPSKHALANTPPNAQPVPSSAPTEVHQAPKPAVVVDASSEPSDSISGLRYRRFRYVIDSSESTVTFHFSQPLDADEVREARELVAHGSLKLQASDIGARTFRLVARELSALDEATRITIAMVGQNWQGWESCGTAAWFVLPSPAE